MQDDLKEERKLARYGAFLAVFLLGAAVGGIAAMALDPEDKVYDDAAGASDPKPS